MKSAPTPLTRRRMLLLAVLLLTLWATWQIGQETPAPKIVAERTARRAPIKPAPPSPVLPLLWSARAEAQPPIIDIFSTAPPTVVASPAVVAAGSPKPVFSLKYIGHLLAEDTSHAFLTDEQDHVIAAKVGQTLGNNWQLTAMTDKQLVFRHTTTGQEQTLQIGTLQ